MKLSTLGIAIVSLWAPLQASPINSSDLIIGQPALKGTGNCNPFGCPAFFGLQTYEQIYSSKAFPGLVTIEELSFFDTVVHNGAQPAGGTYTLSFSYTSMQPKGLDLSNPSNNIGSGSQLFFTGTLPALSHQTLDFEGKPFAYDPSHGNLLLTVSVAKSTDHHPALYLDQSSTPGVTSNAYFGKYLGVPVSGGNDIGGLVTGFTFHPNSVPEPESWFLMLSGAGLCLSMVVLRRRR